MIWWPKRHKWPDEQALEQPEKRTTSDNDEDGNSQRNGRRRTTTKMETARPTAGQAEEQQSDRCPDGPDKHRGTDLATDKLPKSGRPTTGTDHRRRIATKPATMIETLKSEENNFDNS